MLLVDDVLSGWKGRHLGWVGHSQCGGELWEVGTGNCCVCFSKNATCQCFPSAHQCVLIPGTYVLQMSPAWETSPSSARWKCWPATAPSLATTSCAASRAAGEAAASHRPTGLAPRGTQRWIQAACPGPRRCPHPQCPPGRSSCPGAALQAGCLGKHSRLSGAPPHPALSPEVPAFRTGELPWPARLPGRWLSCTSPLPIAAASAPVVSRRRLQLCLRCQRGLLRQPGPRGGARGAQVSDGLRGPPLWNDEQEGLCRTAMARGCLALRVRLPDLWTPRSALRAPGRALQGTGCPL